jgi:hypothetical protein
MTTLKIHRRQWVVSTCPEHPQLAQLSDFRTREIGSSLYLHHDRELGIADGPSGLVLGRMIRPGDGRYVIIREGQLSLDATASMGVHYLTQGPVICSSSPTLISKLSGKPPIRPGSHSKLSWIPAPGSPAQGASRLFLDQELNLITRTVSVKPRRLNEFRTLEEASQILAQESLQIAYALRETGKPLFVALTGGQDSRTIFSALVKAKVPFTAFTFLLSDGASHRDARTAAALCKLCGVAHMILHFRQRSVSCHNAA